VFEWNVDFGLFERIAGGTSRTVFSGRQQVSAGRC
jgi:hypothetical protein